MATEQIHHNFDTADMPEIRQMRSQYLRAFRCKSKLDRLDKISQAILSDIDWKKLGFDSGYLDHFDDIIDDVNNEIVALREKVKEKLEYAINCMYKDVMDIEAETPKEQRIYGAAFEMATKYHSRNSKSGRRQLKNRKSKKTPSKAPAMPKPAKSPSKAPIEPSTIPPQYPSRNTKPSPPKPITRASTSTKEQRATSSTKYSSTTRTSKNKQPIQPIFQGSTSSSCQSNLKTFFKVSKPNLPQPASKPTHSSKSRAKHSSSNSKSAKPFTI